MPDEIPRTVVKEVAVCNWVPDWDPKDNTSIVLKVEAEMGELAE
jgi:hypothetical protein